MIDFVRELDRTRKKWRSLCQLVLSLSFLIELAVSIPIDNSLSDEPAVTCGADALSIDFQTKKSFTGRIFVKGFSQDSNCQLMAEGRDRVMGFSINFANCGLRRNREMNGVSITTTVVVSFHPIFITKVDRAYRLNCFYQESRRTVSQQLDVSMLTTRTIYKQTQLPTCKYEILAEGPAGQAVKYAKIGDLVYHKWSCEAEMPSMYCMKVHSCTVNDGQGGELVYVLDPLGCEVDSYVLQSLDYTSDLIAGQAAYVFKFADKPTLHFNCQIELTMRDQQAGCTYSQPQCEVGSEASYVNGGLGNSYGSPPPPPAYSTAAPAQPESYPTPVPFDRGGIGGSTAARLNTGAPSNYVGERPSYIHQPLPVAQYKIAENHSSAYNTGDAGYNSVPDIYAPSIKPTSNDSSQTQVFPSNRAAESGSYEETPATNSPYDSSPSSKAYHPPPGYGAEVDPNYQDEMDAFAMNRPSTVDYRNSNTGGPQFPAPAARKIQKREAKKVADFDLPEQSLVVIEIDENPLSEHLWTAKSLLSERGRARCVSMGFFFFVLRANRRFSSSAIFSSGKSLSPI